MSMPGGLVHFISRAAIAALFFVAFAGKVMAYDFLVGLSGKLGIPFAAYLMPVAMAFDLLGGLRPDIGCVNLGAAGVRGPQRGQAGHPSADDEDLRGGDLAGRSHLTAEGAPELVGRLDHCPVTGDVGH